jgi:general secretion pathway protein L
MAESLLLRLPRDPEQSAAWLIVDARGAPVGPPQSGPLNLAAARVTGRRVCVLVPGTDVLLAQPDLPLKAGVKLQQLVPYALEEHLADNIDDLHFALGKRAGQSARVPVAVVARALLNEWLATLRAAGINADAMYADSDLLPENPGQAVVLLEEDAVFVRPPGGNVVTLPADALAQGLEIAQSDSDTASGARGLILYTGAAEWQRHSAQVEAVRGGFDGIKIQLLTGGPLALFAQQLPGGAAINLLQGSYTPTASRAVGFRAWRVAAMLLAGLIGLHIAGKAAEWQVLKKREHQVDATIRDTYRSAMGSEPPGTAEARHHMEARLLAAQRAGGGLLPALQAFVQARDAAPGASMQALNFHGGSLEMKLSAPDASSLDHLSQALRGGGWQADLIGGSNVPQGYEGRIQLRATGM